MLYYGQKGRPARELRMGKEKRREREREIEREREKGRRRDLGTYCFHGWTSSSAANSVISPLVL